MTPDTARRTPGRQEIEDRLDALFRLDEEDAGELLLVRHAQPAAAHAWLEAGDAPDPMLSCEGLRQAERLADRLCGLWIDAVYSAPERRCFQTAKVVSDALQRPLSVVDGLADIGFDPEGVCGDAESYADRFCSQPRWESLPGFAPGRDFRRRAVAAIEAVIAAHPARRCVVVASASVLNAYLSMLLCVPRDRFFAPDYAGITTVRHSRDLYGLRALNDTSHLSLSDLVQSPPRAFTPRSLPLTSR